MVRVRGVINAEDVNEIYQMREVLEGLATRLVASVMDEERLAALEGLLRAGEEAVRRGDLSEHTRIDLEFHRRIREWAGNRRLARALDNLQDQVRIVFRTSAAIPGRMQKALKEHRQMLNALAAGNPDQAEAAARTHIRQIREAVMAYLAASK